MSDTRKLFAGGLSQDTSEKDLEEYFSKYGTVESVELKKDNVTQKSRGFGFVLFQDKEALEAACAEAFHTIKGKKIEPRKAKAQTSKIFVGGLKTELSDDDIKNHFGQFGTIVEAEMPFDKQQDRRKGFCFLVYEGNDTAKNVIGKGKQTINGIELDVKAAVPSQKDGGGRGGRGGGRGGPRGGRGGGGYGQQNGGYGNGYAQQNGGYANGYAQQGYDMSGYGGGYDYSAGYDQSWGYGAAGNGYGAAAANGYGGGYEQQSFRGKSQTPRGRGRGRGAAPY